MQSGTRRALIFVALMLLCAFAWSKDSLRNPKRLKKTHPPQYLSIPIIGDVPRGMLDKGHYVFGKKRVRSSLRTHRQRSRLAIPSIISLYPLAAVDLINDLDVGTDRDVSNRSTSYEGETSAASFGNLIVAGSNDSDDILAYASRDGIHWAKTALPRQWNGTVFGNVFDPSIDVDKRGVFYYVYGGLPLEGDYPGGIVAVKSTDGIHWTKLSPITFNESQFFDDKYYLAIDRSNTRYANRIYVAWTRNTGTNQVLSVSYSSNGGKTWSKPIKVDDGKSDFERVLDAYPAVDHNTGIVYVSWQNFARDKIYVDKSTNGGRTWGKDVVAANTYTGFGVDIGCVGGRAQGPVQTLKVGSSGILYLVYPDHVVGRGFDVLFTRSTDGGAHWSRPVVLNDDPGFADQFHSTLSVEPNGRGGDKVTVTFYDRRDDPDNCSAHVYATQSLDNGLTWTPNVRQTSESSNFDGNGNGPGDYSSSIPYTSPTLGHAVWPFFSDHRSSNQETGYSGAFEIYTVDVRLDN